MQTFYEWQISEPPPEGTVSLVIRMTVDEAATLATIDLSSATQPDAATSRSLARPIVQALQDAIAQGALVLP